jgi:hypothetical protein
MLVAAVGYAVACSSPVGAEPWIAPGNTRTRHDLQQLVDAGLVTGPAMSWPVAWSQLARELGQVDIATLSSAQGAAVARLRTEAAYAARAHESHPSARLSLAADPMQIRTFEYTPREDAEASVAVDWLGTRVAWKLEATVVADPDDDQSFRPDGSYLAVSLGNWMLSAGYLDRWWGPGWDGSLILSTNARPVPSIGLDRNESRPFDVPVLRWLGPWRLSTFMGRLERDRDYAHALLFGLRAEIRPHPTLQIGLSRTAQWCGEGRPCGLGTFWDLLSGNDNTDVGLPPEKEPGNQLAGFDLRWSWPAARVPLALYAQGIGEDEAGFLPSKYLGLFGVEVWGDFRDASWRLHVEYADTACDFVNSEPQFGCAYTHSIYTSGYRYRGRVLGHAMDADGESVAIGAMYLTSAGHRWEASVRDFKINRAGVAPGHSLADGPAQVRDLYATHERAYAWGNITVSVGYSDVQTVANTVMDDGVRGFVTWRRDFR